jgi:MarR-like DNA-binding transcriptional regulator SgrR of sgrS sRNA
MYSAGSQADVFSMVDSIETPDDYTVVFNLDTPLADFPVNLAAWSWIYPSELVDDEPLRQEVSIGTGPFIQDEWIRPSVRRSRGTRTTGRRMQPGTRCRTWTVSWRSCRAT